MRTTPVTSDGAGYRSSPGPAKGAARYNGPWSGPLVADSETNEKAYEVTMSGVHDVGVIFDMDGVLIDSARPHLESWLRLGKENDQPITDEAVRRTFGRQNRDIIPTLFGSVGDQRMQELADRKEAIYRDLVRENPPVVDGAIDLVRELFAAGVHLAVGSSAPRLNIELVLDAMGVADCMTAVVSGDDVTRGKPDPQVFSMAADQLGLPPARCVVVEDAPVGIEAARAAGTRCVAVLMHHPADSFPTAHEIVARLVDLTSSGLIRLASGD